MARRSRNTKKLAQRINLEYFKTLSGFSYWRRILSVVAVLAGLAWLGWYALAGSPKPYNAGPLSHAHALLGEECGACHASAAGYRHSASDSACLTCHDGPVHHANQTFTPACSDCHIEHQGAAQLAKVADRVCTQCHAELTTKTGASKFASNIHGFDSGHPEFSVLRLGATDPGTIRFNHRVHLQSGLRGPRGPADLQCSDCHQPSGRSAMAPINYERQCAACHPLQFDARFSEPAPHQEPRIVYDFVFAKLTAYIAAHPGEISRVDPPDKRLPTHPPRAPARNAAEWVHQRMDDAELLLWRKACHECHSLSYPSGSDALPAVAKSDLTARWLQHARFDHRAHQMVGCDSCHVNARSSEAASDILIPGIQTCRTCHRSGSDAAEAGCVECHTYHDWGQEKPVAGKYTLKQFAK
jgi:hypothetical protein